MKSSNGYEVVKTEKQKDAIRLIVNNKYTLLEGGGRCFVGDQKVITDKGSKTIRDVKEGDRVLSCNNKGKEEYNTVVKKHSFKNNKKKMIEIKLKNGETIKGTYDHNVYYKKKWRPLYEIMQDFNRNMA